MPMYLFLYRQVEDYTGSFKSSFCSLTNNNHEQGKGISELHNKNTRLHKCLS